MERIEMVTDVGLNGNNNSTVFKFTRETTCQVRLVCATYAAFCSHDQGIS